MSQYQDLYNKVVQDENFRRELLKDPSAALRSIGIEPTHQLLPSKFDGVDVWAIIGVTTAIEVRKAIAFSMSRP